MSDVWSALSDATRREILSMLKQRDMTAGEIAEKFELSKATVSHHLSILKEAGPCSRVRMRFAWATMVVSIIPL